MCDVANRFFDPRYTAGLVPPAAAVALLGKGGAVMIVLIILMAIT